MVFFISKITKFKLILEQNNSIFSYSNKNE